MNKEKTINKEIDKPISKRRIIIRLVLFIVFFFLGIGLILNGVIKGIDVGVGWKEIETTVDSSKPNCSSEILFKVYFSDIKSSKENNTLYKQIRGTYDTYVCKTYEMFDPTKEYDDTVNLGYLNNHLNTDVTLEPYLFESIKKCLDNDFKYIYYGPLLEYYDGIFYSFSSTESKSFDPYYNQDSKDVVETIINFINNDAIKLTYNESTIKLYVSSEYISYLDELELSNYIDFGFTKYAFYIDLLSKTLDSNNIFNYSIDSLYGFSCYHTSLNLVKEYNLFDLKDNNVNEVGQLCLTSNTNIINYKTYPLSSLENLYYIYSSSNIANPYIKDNGYYKENNDILYLTSTKELSTMLIETYNNYIDNTSCVDYGYVKFDNYNIDSNIKDSINLTLSNDYTYIK